MNENSTLEEIKKYLHDNSEKGVDCPACDRIVKIYKYTMNAGMCLALITMYKLDKSKENEVWFHLQKEFAEKYGLNANALHYSLMKWWGLLIPQPNNDPNRKGTGYWCLTDKGKQFIEGRIRLPKKVHIYDNRNVGWSEETTNIKEALKEKFDYAELMGDYLKTNEQRSLL